MEGKVKEAALALPVFNKDFAPEIRPADERFGDFQANGPLTYLGRNKIAPRPWIDKLCKRLLTLTDSSEKVFSVTVAGPGFLNFQITEKGLIDWLKNFYLEATYQKAAASFFKDRTIVIDYSSPNTAKRMHVGHLRSMVIGESLQRLLRFGGANVIRDNHIGDWGTQFGILLLQIKKTGYSFSETPEQTIESLERLYKMGSEMAKNDPHVLDQARQELVKLQKGDEENRTIWEKINQLSYESFRHIYDRMGVQFDWVLGESFYRDKVDEVYEELEACGLAKLDQGALAVFHPEHPRFNNQPFLIRKSDGASNYASTDLATVKYRVDAAKADTLVYVTDSRQKDHFEQLFLTVEKWFQVTHRPLPKLHHIYFGTVLDASGKAIKTREGEAIQLQDLLNEAVERAYKLIQEKSPELDESTQRRVAEVVGLGSIKYSDLSQERTGNYRFEWDKMINFDGNTAPYLLYAVARIHAIFRKLNLDARTWCIAKEQAPSFSTDNERSLARKLIAFPGILSLTLREFKPHWLCRYLFELAGCFSAFYAADKVKVENMAIQQLRLLLCKATLSTLETGLHLLGLETLERM